VLAVPLLVMLVSLPAGVGAIELEYHGLEPGNSNRWPGKGLLTDPGVAWVLHGHFSAGTVADNGIVLVSSGGEVELVDPKAGRVVRRLAVVPGLRGPLLVARVKGRELVVGTRLPTRASRPGEVRCELVTVNLRSGGVESVRLPAVEGSVVGCLDVDGDGDDEALVLSDGLCCYELSPPRLRWMLRGNVMGVAIDAEGKPRAVLLVRRGRLLELLEVDLRLGRVLRVVGLGRWLPRLVVWAPAIKVPTGVVRSVIIGGPTGKVVLADVDGDGEREVVCTVDGEWEGPGPWLQVS